MTPPIRQARVQFVDPRAPIGRQEESTAAFLTMSHHAALARFRTRGDPHPKCRTIEYRVPPKAGDDGSTGVIVAHISPQVSEAWQGIARGTLKEKRKAVQTEMRLALGDLAEQDMHGYLALTAEQRAVYNPDFVQMMNEALDRTTFTQLRRPPDARWQGTLVESVEPPYLILVVSLAFADPRTRRNRSAARGKPPL